MPGLRVIFILEQTVFNVFQPNGQLDRHFIICDTLKNVMEITRKPDVQNEIGKQCRMFSVKNTSRIINFYFIILQNAPNFHVV